jgi:hypothetical protein
VNYVNIPETGTIDNGLADHMQEAQWVVENVTRDLREHAEYFGQYKRYREWAAFMNTDADLLDQAWRRLKWQLRPNPLLDHGSHPERGVVHA